MLKFEQIFFYNLSSTSNRSKQKRLGAYPYMSVVFSITLALFVVGVLGTLIIHSNKLSKLIKENVEIQVYLKKEVSDAQRLKIHKTLEQFDFVAQDENGIPRVDFISRDQAAKRFIEETGEDFVEFLGENPLRDVYVVNINPDHQTEEGMSAIEASIMDISGVFEVEYVENLVREINSNISRISLVLVGFAGILILVVIILINNTIKLALFSQRFLIRSMQLVGAKRSFIRMPFLQKSALHGLVGGVLASMMLFALMEYAYDKIPDLSILKDMDQMLILFGCLLVLGTILGFLSTLRSVNKYLTLTLDELY